MKVSAKARYEQLTIDREAALSKARKVSDVTIYGLIPDTDDPTASSEFKNSYSSFGNNAAGNLASQLVFSALPAGQKFFRKDLTAANFTENQLKELMVAVNAPEMSQLAEIIKDTLITNSNLVQDYFEAKGIRSTYNETMQHLIVAGNVVVKYTEKGSRNYNINNFVIIRDNEDNLINELITREKIRKEELSKEELQSINEITGGNTSEDPSDYTYNEAFDMYTHIKLNQGGKTYTLFQEIEGVKIKEDTEYGVDELPYVAPRLYKQSDLNYGESYAYRFYDDLRDLNNFRKYFIEGASVLTRLIYLVNPSARTNVRALAKTPNGGFAKGRDGEITTLQPNNVVQLQQLQAIIESIESKLRESFLMLNVRNSERTTAEEIRAVQQQLDQQLGGVFSTISQELQLPSVKIVESILRDYEPAFVYVPYTKDKIVTGVDAIGRSQEVESIRGFISLMLEASQVSPGIVQYVNEEWLANKVLVASGVDEDAQISKSEVEQLRAQQQQAMQEQAMQEQAIASGGKMMEESVKQSGDQQQQQQ